MKKWKNKYTLGNKLLRNNNSVELLSSLNYVTEKNSTSVWNGMPEDGNFYE